MIATLFKMARAKTNTTYMFPSLHQRVLNTVFDEVPSVWFNENDTTENSKKECQTSVMGKFQCDNSRCSKNGWSSKKVCILIRGYPKNGYNAVVFNQRCKSCNQLGTLTLDEDSYVERVTYRLRKWAGVPVTPPYYNRKQTLPHKQEFCEGCKRGYCEKSGAGFD
ncbi:zinc-binding domain-containing protein [Biscogniauxia mediterranea]|nr:zinc-binding domain-containing protein [Biscogniauxia mediterranea]